MSKKGGILIDNIINKCEEIKSTSVEIDGRWYIARPIQMQGGGIWKITNFVGKIRACWRILNDRGLVVYYKQDENF